MLVAVVQRSIHRLLPVAMTMDVALLVNLVPLECQYTLVPGLRGIKLSEH